MSGIAYRSHGCCVVEVEINGFCALVASNLRSNLFQKAFIVFRIKQNRNAMEPVIYHRTIDHSIVKRNFGKADTAEADVVCRQSVYYILPPPAGVPEFNNICK